MTTSDTYKRAKQIIELAISKKAKDVVLMDLHEISNVADYFICCHGDSDVQVKAISEMIEHGMRERGQRPWHTEGSDYYRWVLLDYVDIVVHVFQEEMRNFYALERLWGDAKTETFGEND